MRTCILSLNLTTDCGIYFTVLLHIKGRLDTTLRLRRPETLDLDQDLLLGRRKILIKGEKSQ